MKFRQLVLLSLLALSGPVPANLLGSVALPPISANLPSGSQAPIALLADLSSGQILFARDANMRFLPASVTKAMTALVVFDLISAGQLDEQAVVKVQDDTARRWAGKGTTLNLRPGEAVKVGDLLMGTTTVSANDAAVALAEAAAGSTETFVTLMNARAQSLGMGGSRFATPNGFPDDGRTYVTANDLVRLATALIKQHPALYARYFGKRAMIWRGTQLTSHDPFAGVLPGADGIKTGHTYEAGFNFLGAVERGGRRLVVVIGGARTEPGRASAAKALAEWGYSAWDSYAFLPAESIVGEVRVQGGTARSVPVAVPRAFSLALPKGKPADYQGFIHYNGPVKAPIAKGQPIGRLELMMPSIGKHSLPLVAAETVETAGPIDRIVNALLELFA